MLKPLLRTRLLAMLSILTGSSRTKKAQSKGKLVGFAVLMVLSLFSLSTLFSHIFESIGTVFQMFGLGWLYFAFAAILSFGLMLVGNVFAAKAQLYEARDNDLLLSMPIRPFHILLSRLFLLLVLALVLMLPVAIPAVLFWPGELKAAGWIGFVLIFLVVLPLLNLVISSFLGWLLHLASTRARNKSLITLLLSLGFLGIYMYFSFRMNSMISNLAADPSGLERSLGSAAPLVWIGRAIAEGKALYLVPLVLGTLVLFVVCLWLLSRTFIQTATDRRGTAKIRYVERTAQGLSPRRALLRHELSRLWASPAYMLNGALGSFFLLIAAVALLIKGKALTGMPEWPFLASIFKPMIIVGLCWMAVTTFLTAPSISLEGRCLWLPKSLPLSSWEILSAKLRLHMLIALPPLVIVSVVTALVLGYRGALLALLLTAPLCCGVFSGLFGLFENLRHPNFNWINETQAVKSGASVLITMFGGWGVVVLPLIVALIWGDRISVETIGFIFLGVMVLACVLLYAWLRKKGPRVFEEL